jgi:ribosomal protein L15E
MDEYQELVEECACCRKYAWRTQIWYHQLIGNTIGGRRLKIIFQLKPGNVVRIITGWQV